MILCNIAYQQRAYRKTERASTDAGQCGRYYSHQLGWGSFRLPGLPLLFSQVLRYIDGQISSKTEELNKLVPEPAAERSQFPKVGRPGYGLRAKSTTAGDPREANEDDIGRRPLNLGRGELGPPSMDKQPSRLHKVYRPSDWQLRHTAGRERCRVSLLEIRRGSMAGCADEEETALETLKGAQMATPRSNSCASKKHALIVYRMCGTGRFER